MGGFLHFLLAMSDPRSMVVVWRMNATRCELWASASGSYQLRLFDNNELVRMEETTLDFYGTLAHTWKLEVDGSPSQLAHN